ncbi:ribonuclease H-like domain-containing protein [Candidatus Woesearchaeota archaeon]|nr:ribonuclease H-like domain-containing protein [Candidatus Woesearchaeota archaeon]
MLERCFLFLDRIGPEGDLLIRRQGIPDWESFLAAQRVRGISKTRKLFYDRRLREAQGALADGDSHHFSARLPPKERWRLWEPFRRKAVFLDIETSEHYGDITVLGISDGERTRQLVKGADLDPSLLTEALEGASLLVTYNGEGYDLRVIERYHPGCLPAIGHLDLRFACQQAGFVGGLKAVERQLGIVRDPDLDLMVGEDAIYLWNAFLATRKADYLERLLAYNRADCENLLPIAERVCAMLAEKDAPAR